MAKRNSKKAKTSIKRSRKGSIGSFFDKISLAKDVIDGIDHYAMGDGKKASREAIALVNKTLRFINNL